jgi:F0F1-type ATP synthase assembly protein I
MNNNFGHRYRLVTRVVLLQMGCAALTGLLFWLMNGAAAAIAALSGGMIVAVGSGMFGWRMFAPGIAAAAKLRKAMFTGELLKWIWFGAAIWTALTRLELMPLPLITGVVIAQLGYFGLIVLKRG